MRLFIAVVVEGGEDVAIKMRNNTKPEAICCECGEGQKEVLNMFRQLTFNLHLTPWHISAKKIKQIRIFENLIRHIRIRRR